MYTHKAYLIETLTNTHVGSGDTGFGVVENLIQKDPTTHIPVFHSSSLKGSIREHFEQYYKNSEIPENDFNIIFGEGEDKPGQVKFYEARLLTLPLRSSQRVYYNCTSPEVMLDYLTTLKTFRIGVAAAAELDLLIELFGKFKNGFSTDKYDFCVFTNDHNGLVIEDYSNSQQYSEEVDQKLFEKYCKLNMDSLAVFRDEIFCSICEESLPVMARNKIAEDGTSENLFYEEILPRRSKLWFMLGFNKEEPVFEGKLKSDLIQIGANYSIGYGATKINPVGV